MSDVEKLQSELEAMAKRVVMLEQFINSATRSEPAGTTTVGSLTNISDTQLADNPLFYVEHADGGLNVYLSQIVAQAQKRYRCWIYYLWYVKHWSIASNTSRKSSVSKCSERQWVGLGWS